MKSKWNFLLALWLVWNASTSPNVVYEIWHSTDLTFWTPAAETPDTQWQIPAGKKQEFFKVRARDLYTGQVSDWNQ